MKKVGIITYHFARNYGAVLQCFALQECLRKRGYEVYILNAVSRTQEKNNSLFHKRDGVKNLVVNVLLLPFVKQRIEKEHAFSFFVSQYLNCTRRVTNNEELNSLIETDRYDVVISGSDQVFNPHIADFDDMFLFPFEIEAKKIGYSVSIGESSYDEIKKYADYIKDFHQVGVRELTAKPVIEKLYGKETDSTIDPVLLLAKSDWEHFVEKENSEVKYLLCYFIDKDPIAENMTIAEEIAKKKGLGIKVIWMHLTQKSFDKRFINNAGPIEFLNYIYNADAVITDGYHGTVFSTIFEKEIYSIINHRESTDTRIKDYLTLIGLDRRLIYMDDKKIDYLSIDYSVVSSRITELPQESYDFLDVAIS